MKHARLFKQGYYDYKYVFLRNDGILDEGFISGNFVSTENDYTVLIYYLPPGGRYTTDHRSWQRQFFEYF